MEKERILELIEELMYYGRMTDSKRAYNQALLDLAEKVVEESDGEHRDFADDHHRTDGMDTD